MRASWRGVVGGLVLVAAPCWATAVLLVPKTESARPVCEDLLEVFTAQKLTVKMAGPASAATSCLKQPAAKRGSCLLDTAKAARVDGVVLVSATKGAQVLVTLELLSKTTGAVAKRQKVRAARKQLKRKAAPVVQRLIVDMLAEEPPTTDPVPPVASLEDEEPEDLTPLPPLSAQADATPPAAEPVPEPEPESPVPQPTPKPQAVAVAEPPASPPVSDTPRHLSLTPAPSTEPVVARSIPKRTNVAAIVTTVATIGAASAAGILSYLAFADRDRLANAPNGISPLAYSEAVALQSKANSELTLALSAAIGAGLFAVLSTVLWATP